jgi:hypothetical protein
VSALLDLTTSCLEGFGKNFFSFVSRLFFILCDKFVFHNTDVFYLPPS